MQLQDKLNTLRNNPRLVFGLWMVVLTLWLYGLLDMREQFQREVQDYNGVVRKIRHIQANAAQKDWLQRKEDADRMLAGIESGLWRESTPGLAQAALNDWLTQAAQQAGIQNMQLAVALQPSSGKAQETNGQDPGVAFWKVSTRLVSEFNPKTYYSLLEKIVSNNKLLKIESLTIRTAPSPKAELMLTAYFVPGASLDKANEKK